MDIVQAILGIALVTLLPGLALSFAIEPSRTLSAATRLGWAIGLSLSVTIVGGILLAASGTPLAGPAWYALLATSVVGAAGIAIMRRSFADGAWYIRLISSVSAAPNAANAGRPKPHTWVSIGSRFVRSNWQIFPVGGAVAAMALTIVVTYQVVQAKPHVSFTQLWIVPQQDSPDNAVLIGVRNFENINAEFRIEAWSSTERIAVWESIRLSHGEEWTHRLTFPSPPWPAIRERPVEVLLYWRDQTDKPYRRVSLACDGVSQENSDEVQRLYQKTASCVPPTIAPADGKSGPGGSAAPKQKTTATPDGGPPASSSADGPGN